MKSRIVFAALAAGVVVSVGIALQSAAPQVSTGMTATTASAQAVLVPQFLSSLPMLQQNAIAGPGVTEGTSGFLYELTAGQAPESVIVTIQNLGDTRIDLTSAAGNTTVLPGHSLATRIGLTPGGTCGNGLVCWAAGPGGSGVCQFAWVVRR
jgi:hypothetical protein